MKKDFSHTLLECILRPRNHTGETPVPQGFGDAQLFASGAEGLGAGDALGQTEGTTRISQRCTIREKSAE